MKKRKISSQENWKIFEYNNTAFIFLFSSLDDFKRSSFCNHVPFQPLPILLSIYIYIYINSHVPAHHTHTPPSPSILAPSLLPTNKDEFDNLRAICLSHRCPATIPPDSRVLHPPSPPRPSLSKRQRRIFRNEEKTMERTALSTQLISAPRFYRACSKLGNRCKSSNGFRREKRVIWKRSNTPFLV